MPHNPKSDTLILFGAGSGASIWIERNNPNLETTIIVDNNPRLWNKRFRGCLVKSPLELEATDFCSVLILVSQVPEVIAQLHLIGVPPQAIVIPPKPTFRPQPFQTPEGRLLGMNLLKELIAVIRDSGLTPIVEQGAALGIFRDKGLIPWDNDLDISVFSPHPDGLQNLLSSLKKLSSVQIVNCKIDSFGAQILLLSTAHSIPISIFSRSVDGAESRSPDAEFITLPMEVVYPPIDFKIEAGTFPLPRLPESYFALIYGKDWKTPRPGFTFLDYAQQGTPEV